MLSTIVNFINNHSETTLVLTFEDLNIYSNKRDSINLFQKKFTIYFTTNEINKLICIHEGNLSYEFEFTKNQISFLEDKITITQPKSNKGDELFFPSIVIYENEILIELTIYSKGVNAIDKLLKSEFVKSYYSDLYKIEEIQDIYKNGKYASFKTLSSENKNCYIATVAFDDNNHPVVEKFRQFRNEYLLNNYLGKYLVSKYYLVSPQLSVSLKNKTTLNKSIKLILIIISKILPLKNS